MPMRARRGIRCTPASPCSGSTTRTASASTAPAPTTRNPISPACAAANSDITTTSPDPISSATLARRPGARTSAASATASRCIASSGWRCGAGRRSISAATGNVRMPLRGQSPTDDPRGLDPRDRLLGPVERTEDRLLNQLPLAVIGHRHGLDAHDPLGELTRRHRLDRIAQLVVDQPKALTGTEPCTACPLLPGSDSVRPDVRIEQPHRRIEMRQIGLLLAKLSFKLDHYSSQFRPLVA